MKKCGILRRIRWSVCLCTMQTVWSYGASSSFCLPDRHCQIIYLLIVSMRMHFWLHLSTCNIKTLWLFRIIRGFNIAPLEVNNTSAMPLSSTTHQPSSLCQIRIHSLVQHKQNYDLYTQTPKLMRVFHNLPGDSSLNVCMYKNCLMNSFWCRRGEFIWVHSTEITIKLPG